MDGETLFLEHVALIDRITAFVCRRNRLQPDDADEFHAHVRFKLFEDDYAILRKFEGRSSLSTYLTTVITRLFYQHRVQMWGKWRPSAEARRLGDKAIVVERMLTRDGLTLDEVIRELTTGEASQFTRREIELIYVRLPPRQPRPVLVSEEMSAGVAAESTADQRVLRSEREQAARKVAAVIDATIETMDADDQTILRLRFWNGYKIADIAVAMHAEPKKLYKRVERLTAQLRRALVTAGISSAEISDLLTHGDLHLTFRAAAPWENPLGGPSDPTDGNMTTGQGRHSG